jgi:hypothetical protein
VGLVQRRLEAAGFSTIALSSIPDLTASVGVPRLVGIERPGGMNVGEPGDFPGQLAALRGTLDAMTRIDSPGQVVHLPIAASECTRVLDLRPPHPPPIAKYLMRHPWAVPRFLRRDPPDAGRGDR